MHSLSWLAPNGTAAIVCFPGIMYRGGAEKKIRQYLVDNNYIDCIIQLPSNLFFGTSISTCIMVLKKGKVDDKILFIDASKEFVKVTNNNRLTQENIQHIMDTYVQRTEIVHYAHVASHKEVVNNNRFCLHLQHLAFRMAFVPFYLPKRIWKLFFRSRAYFFEKKF